MPYLEDRDVDIAIEFLNEWAAQDPNAVISLVNVRVPCNKFTLDHPSIQAGIDNGAPQVGFLGVLNGLFGTIGKGELAGYGKICFVHEAQRSRTQFARTEEVFRKEATSNKVVVGEDTEAKACLALAKRLASWFDGQLKDCATREIERVEQQMREMST